MRLIEEKLSQVVDESKLINLSLDELIEMLKILYEEI